MHACMYIIYCDIDNHMYSTERLEVPSKTTMERMYSTKSTLSGEGNISDMPRPKKENMLQSMFNALNSFIWEPFSKVPGTFMANINNPLSVTVVQNEGIISHEFFKTLTTRKDALTSDNLFVHDIPTKESLNIVDRIHCGMFDETISYINGSFNESMKENFKCYNKHGGINSDQIVERSDEIKPITKENIDKPIKNVETQKKDTSMCTLMLCNNLEKDAKGERPECICSNVTCETHAIIHFHNCVNADAEATSFYKQTTDASMDTKTFIDDEYAVIFSPEGDETESENTVKEAGMSNLLTNIWQKLVDVTDRLNLNSESVERVASAKRSISPKQRRKLNTVAKGRGRGRARPQLRRSGVSQTRHRKERTKHDLVVDIQDDFESWQEFEIYHTVQSKDSVQYFSYDENDVDVPDAPEFLTHESASPLTFTFADLKPRSRKLNPHKIVDQDASNFSARVRYVPECTMEAKAFYHEHNDTKYESQKNAFRPRLISESSVDSEDSYCIVFETGSETNHNSDFDDDEGSDDDQSTEDDESECPTQKVKFNLKPVVHVMVQWDYAYRAARRGPWEEMARDRERFRGRINCIERVLNPILTKQHRTHVWQQRFAPEE